MSVNNSWLSFTLLIFPATDFGLGSSNTFFLQPPLSAEGQFFQNVDKSAYHLLQEANQAYKLPDRITLSPDREQFDNNIIRADILNHLSKKEREQLLKQLRILDRSIDLFSFNTIEEEISEAWKEILNQLFHPLSTI